MGKLFVLLWSPVAAAWAFMEGQLWLSLAALAALTVGTAMMGMPAVAGAFALLLGILLMRADAILAPPAAPVPLAAD